MNNITRLNRKKNPYKNNINKAYDIVSLGLQSELLWLMTNQPFNKFAINNCKIRIKGLKNMKKAYNISSDFAEIFSNYP